MRGGWGVSGPARSARRVRTRAFDEGDLCHSGTRRNRLTEDKAYSQGPPKPRERQYSCTLCVRETEGRGGISREAVKEESYTCETPIRTDLAE